METPRYVLKVNEGIVITDPNKMILALSRYMLWFVAGAILIGSIILKSNLLSELSLTSKILLALMLVYSITWKTKKAISLPLELRFYNEYLVIYREKIYHSATKVIHKEINTVRYDDVKICEHNAKTNRISIIGKYHFTWYNYDRSGVVSQTANRDSIIDNALVSFVVMDNDINITKEIENHSPIKVNQK